MSELRMWIAVRRDLQMSVGKLAAQVGHAVCQLMHESTAGRVQAYMTESQAKIVLGVPNLQALERFRDECKSAGLTYAFIVDEGRTELPPNTPTVAAVGPHTMSLLPAYIKRLRLY